ncbi:Double-stranded RNA-binding protein 2, partial [Cucurbita argyrosperma subsp. sororia]
MYKKISFRNWRRGVALIFLLIRRLGKGLIMLRGFKASVNFNGEIFESPNHCPTLRLAEHSAAEVALNSLANRGPSHSLAARILDETGVYKNLLQEIAQRVGAPLPQYTTVRSGLGHLPVFTGSIELAGITFTGEPARTRNRQRRMQPWQLGRLLNNWQKKRPVHRKLKAVDEPEQKLSFQSPRATSPQPPPATTSKILPFICKKPIFSKQTTTNRIQQPYITITSSYSLWESSSKVPCTWSSSLCPDSTQYRMPCRGIVPPVTIRTAVPVYAARHSHNHPMHTPRKEFSALHKGDSLTVHKQDPSTTTVEGFCQYLESRSFSCIWPSLAHDNFNQVPETQSPNATSLDETKTVQHLKQLKIQ